jgi:leucyl-tRNA synthetase
MPYDPTNIERKWQERWERDRLYHVADNDPRPKWYELTMYPYPSGDLHIGHWYAYSPYDAHVRFMRMKGFNVLAPFGFDAFGLPAENAAIKRGIHPHSWTMSNIERMREQIKRMGTALDWDREIICCLPEYYRWNQWFFLQLYKHGLAYRAKAPANWCPTCQTVLANEQVVNGKCERTGDIVERRDMEQWFFRITRYAERLLDFSGLVDWPEKIKIMQENWIGRSEGVELAFDISHYNLPERSIKVFTTRPDTVYGVTFMVLAPEHPLVEKLTSPQERATVEQYVAQARRASEVERMSTDREKTGVPIGAYCVNPFNGERVPLYIADYVLATYGTGAVMAVPAHDERDFAFAHKNNLPVKIVIKPKDWDGMQLQAAYTEPGEMMDSGELTGTSAEKALDAVANLAERKRIGQRTISYRIRDWLISRQRYWGTPIPVVYCPTDGIVPVPETDLPVLLPEDAQFKPTGESPLKFHQGFLNTTCPKCHGPAKRETDTMDTFVDSSWYFLRYASPKYEQAAFDPALVKQWAPVDQYTGGAEHAVMHLLYSRFFTKALHDLKLIDFDEPFKRLFNQGIILGEDHEKMSKSRGNVVNPDDFVTRDGADTVRLFLMFVGPWDQGASWSTTGIQGMSRWLNRVWGLATRSAAEHDWKGDAQAIEELERTTHKTVKRVTASLEKFSFNTAIAAMMEFTNELQKYWDGNAVSEGAWKASIERLLVLIAPFTPHVAEELWEATGRSYSIHQQSWPAYDAEKAKDAEVTLIIQVNGKLRDKCAVPASVTEEQATALALKSEKVAPLLEGKQVRKVIYVPGKLVNVVVG